MSTCVSFQSVSFGCAVLVYWFVICVAVTDQSFRSQINWQVVTVTVELRKRTYGWIVWQCSDSFCFTMNLSAIECFRSRQFLLWDQPVRNFRSDYDNNWLFQISVFEPIEGNCLGQMLFFPCVMLNKIVTLLKENNIRTNEIWTVAY